MWIDAVNDTRLVLQPAQNIKYILSFFFRTSSIRLDAGFLLLCCFRLLTQSCAMCFESFGIFIGGWKIFCSLHFMHTYRWFFYSVSFFFIFRSGPFTSIRTRSWYISNWFIILPLNLVRFVYACVLTCTFCTMKIHTHVTH